MLVGMRVAPSLCLLILVSCSAGSDQDDIEMHLRPLLNDCDAKIPSDDYRLVWETDNADRWVVSRSGRMVAFNSASAVADNQRIQYTKAWRRAGWSVQWTLELQKSPEFAAALAMRLPICQMVWRVTPAQPDDLFELHWLRLRTRNAIALHRPEVEPTPLQPILATATKSRRRKRRAAPPTPSAAELRRMATDEIMNWLLDQ